MKIAVDRVHPFVCPFVQEPVLGFIDHTTATVMPWLHNPCHRYWQIFDLFARKSKQQSHEQKLLTTEKFSHESAVTCWLKTAFFRKTILLQRSLRTDSLSLPSTYTSNLAHLQRRACLRATVTGALPKLPGAFEFMGKS